MNATRPSIMDECESQSSNPWALSGPQVENELNILRNLQKYGAEGVTRTPREAKDAESSATFSEVLGPHVRLADGGNNGAAEAKSVD